jgi:hypothetical protein
VAGDAAFERQLTAFFAGPPQAHVFRLVELTFESWRFQLAEFAEYRTLRGGGEWEFMLALRAHLEAGEAVAPLAFCWDEHGSVRMHRRLSSRVGASRPRPRQRSGL